MDKVKPRLKPNIYQKDNTMTNQLEELLEDMVDQAAEQHDDHLKLTKLYELLMVKHKFQVGDLVGWKPGLQNKNTPNKKRLIVTKIYENPIMDQAKDSGSSYFKEQLDIVCAKLTDGSFLEYHFDSRRLQPYEPERQDND